MNTIKYIVLISSLLSSTQPCKAMDDLVGNVGATILFAGVGLIACKEFSALFYGTPLHIAARSNYPKAVQVLLEAGANPNAHMRFGRSTPLHEAVAHGHQEAARILLDNGADINALMTTTDNNQESILVTPLFLAVDKQNIDMIRLLLERKKFITPNHNPFSKAIKDENIEILQLLIDSGQEVDTIHPTLERYLAVAVRENKLHAAHLLLKNGANPNPIAMLEVSPFHLAAQLGHTELVKLLLRYGADPLCTHQGHTPAFYALNNEHQHTALILVTSTLQIKTFNPVLYKRMQTTLMVLKRFGLAKDVRNLILREMPEDVLNEHHAKMLYNAGADINVLLDICPLKWLIKIPKDAAHQDSFIAALARNSFKRFTQHLGQKPSEAKLQRMPVFHALLSMEQEAFIKKMEAQYCLTLPIYAAQLRKKNP